MDHSMGKKITIIKIKKSKSFFNLTSFGAEIL